MPRKSLLKSWTSLKSVQPLEFYPTIFLHKRLIKINPSFLCKSHIGLDNQHGFWLPQVNWGLVLSHQWFFCTIFQKPLLKTSTRNNRLWSKLEKKRIKIFKIRKLWPTMSTGLLNVYIDATRCLRNQLGMVRIVTICRSNWWSLTSASPPLTKIFVRRKTLNDLLSFWRFLQEDY